MMVCLEGFSSCILTVFQLTVHTWDGTKARAVLAWYFRAWQACKICFILLGLYGYITSWLMFAAAHIKIKALSMTVQTEADSNQRISKGEFCVKFLAVAFTGISDGLIMETFMHFWTNLRFKHPLDKLGMKCDEYKSRLPSMAVTATKAAPRKTWYLLTRQQKSYLTREEKKN